MKKSEKIKNGEGHSSGRKREKETKVSFAFHIYEVLGFFSLMLDCLCI